MDSECCRRKGSRSRGETGGKKGHSQRRAARESDQAPSAQDEYFLLSFTFGNFSLVVEWRKVEGGEYQSCLEFCLEASVPHFFVRIFVCFSSCVGEMRNALTALSWACFTGGSNPSCVSAVDK